MSNLLEIKHAWHSLSFSGIVRWSDLLLRGSVALLPLVPRLTNGKSLDSAAGVAADLENVGPGFRPVPAGITDAFLAGRGSTEQTSAALANRTLELRRHPDLRLLRDLLELAQQLPRLCLTVGGLRQCFWALPFAFQRIIWAMARSSWQICRRLMQERQPGMHVSLLYAVTLFLCLWLAHVAGDAWRSVERLARKQVVVSRLVIEAWMVPAKDWAKTVMRLAESRIVRGRSVAAGIILAFCLLRPQTSRCLCYHLNLSDIDLFSILNPLHDHCGSTPLFLAFI
jgi:hypothetical protein